MNAHEMKKNTSTVKKNVKEIKDGYKKVKSYLKPNGNVVLCHLQKYYMTILMKDTNSMITKAGGHQKAFLQILLEFIHQQELLHLTTMIGIEELLTVTVSI